MLRIVTGTFHPILESALLDEVRGLKEAAPFVPVAIVVPSAELADYLKRYLAIESRLPLLNAPVLTLHQFALRVRDDLIRRGRETSSVQLVDDFYYEQLVRQIVKRTLPGLEELLRLPPSPGTWKGLWATLRDLKDAAVLPSTALNGVSEGLFDDDDRSWLRTLFTLHAAVQEGSRSLGVGSADDLVASISHELSGSHFLARCGRIILYGFYDLLQVQLSFFESLVRCASVTLYTPLGQGPSYGFARRFFERHLLPLADHYDDRSQDTVEPAARNRVELTVTHVIGAEEELATICRDILTLIEVHGYRFEEIGVVARSLAPYQSRLQAVFDRHLVPFTSTAGRPLSREPLIKALLRLASLPSNEGDSPAVLDVLASPYARPVEGKETIERRSDVWRVMVSMLGITRGVTDWSRLSPDRAAAIFHDLGTAEEGRAPGPQDPQQATLLFSLANRLIEDCRQLPERGSISLLTGAFEELAKRHFAVPGWNEPGSSNATNFSASRPIGEFVQRALARLLEIDPMGAELSWEEWAELFRLALEETAIPIEGEPHQGVHVLDAMEARGLRFRALFVIGLNEQIFPRFVREDPFLHDRHRQVLSATLGFLIEEKLAGHEEERLLFELLIGATDRRLYLSYQRADEDGRVLAPSPFVTAALHDPRFVSAPERAIPRRLTERVAVQPTIQEIMPVREVALHMLLHEQDAGPLLEPIGQDRSLFEQGLAAQAVMERETPDLGPFDGMLSSQTAPRPPSDQTSLSPTTLESYATCPFRYFAEKILRLVPVRTVMDEPLPALTVGNILHATLRLTYERLAASGWPDKPIELSKLRELITGATSEAFACHAAVRGTGHVLLWSLAQEQTVELAILVVTADQEDYRTTGYRPHAFETEADGVFSLGEDETSLKIHGKLDRVDLRSDPPGLRIVDYKFKQGSKKETEDRNLLLGAARGYRLQPPFYAAMRLPSLPQPDEVRFLYLAPRWEPPIDRSVFEPSQLQGPVGDMIRRTIHTLVQGIERQEFFILPGDYCDHCPFPAACRRNSQTAWWRSCRSKQAGVLRRLRKVKVADE